MGSVLRRLGIVVAVILMSMIDHQSEAVAAGEKEKLGPEQRPSAERHWQIGVTPSYSSGNFGTDVRSDFIYVPFSIRRLFRDGDVTVVVPFVSVTSNGATTLVGGQPTPTMLKRCFKDEGRKIDTDDPECRALLTAGQGATAGENITHSGLGDIIVRGRYYAVEERERFPLVALTARVKIPTASESKGLGTGALDHGYGVELSKMLGDRWIAFLDGGYNFIGDPDGRELQNQYWFDVGGGYYFTTHLLFSVYYEEYRSLVADRVNLRDVFVAFNYKFSDAWRFNGGVTVGLSNSAPDYGVSLGANYRF